ncbi:MAG: hypothetical protein ACR2QM_15595, partial [Longimicrobiales bacterium]
MNTNPPRSPASPAGFRGHFDGGAARLDEVSRSTGPVVLKPVAVASPANVDDVLVLIREAQRQGWT